MASPYTSATILEVELKEYNPGIPLIASPRLLSPTVVPLRFSFELEISISIFAFATCQPLADYNIRPAPTCERTIDSQMYENLSQVREKRKQTVTGQEERAIV